MKQSRRSVFEWGGRRFKERQGLVDILKEGYFLEGNAWGSLRAGWEPVVPWLEVLDILIEAMPGQIESVDKLKITRLVPSIRLPEGWFGPADESPVGKLWFKLGELGFEPAADALWARCEAWMLGGQAKQAKGKRDKREPRRI